MSDPLPNIPCHPEFNPPRRRASYLKWSCGAVAWAGMLFLALGADAYAQQVANEIVEPVRFSLVRGDGAELCPGAQVIEQRVASNLGRNPFALDAPYELEGIVHRADGAWLAVLKLRGRQGQELGERRLEARGESCDDLTRAMVLAIGLTIDPQAPLHPAPAPTQTPAEHESPAPTVAPAPPAAVPESSASSSSACPPAPPPVRPPPDPAAQPAPQGAQLPPQGLPIRIVPNVAVAWGVLPGTAVGAGLSALAFPGTHLSGGLGMLWLSEQRAEQGSFGFGLTAGALQACYRLNPVTGVDASSCLVAQIGAMHATAYADEPLDPGQKLWLAAGGGERVSVQVVEAVSLEVGLDVLGPIVRRDFRLVGADPQRVFLPSPVAAVGHVGIGLNFP